MPWTSELINLTFLLFVLIIGLIFAVLLISALVTVPCLDSLCVLLSSSPLSVLWKIFLIHSFFTNVTPIKAITKELFRPQHGWKFLKYHWLPNAICYFIFQYIRISDPMTPDLLYVLMQFYNYIFCHWYWWFPASMGHQECYIGLWVTNTPMQL